MKPTSTLFLLAAIAFAIFTPGNYARAQQYKIRQVSNMAGMKSETTVYVKGARKRSEGGAFAGMPSITSIEQCDLQRTIKINDRKKLYYIAPFSKDPEGTDDDTKPSANVKTAAVTSKEKSKDRTATKTGGVIYMYYNITDTGERKKMYGLTARHVWTTQKTKPSPDACMMKDSMLIKTDGWYIDLPQFNCIVNSYSRASATTTSWQKPECQDKFVSKHSGKGKLGFPLVETRTMIMGDGQGKSNTFETSVETLEFSSAKLDSMLFEIPVGYAEAKTEEELQDKFDVTQMMQQQSANNRNNSNEDKPVLTEHKKAGMTRIGVYEPIGEDQLQASLIQKHIVNSLSEGNIEAVAVTSEEDAKRYNCDLLLLVEFIKVKQGSKIGGILKAIKNTDPSATSSFNIEANLVLSNISDGSTRSQQKVSGKFEGKVDYAAMKAMDKGCGELRKGM